MVLQALTVISMSSAIYRPARSPFIQRSKAFGNRLRCNWAAKPVALTFIAAVILKAFELRGRFDADCDHAPIQLLGQMDRTAQ